MSVGATAVPQPRNRPKQSGHASCSITDRKADACFHCTVQSVPSPPLSLSESGNAAPSQPLLFAMRWLRSLGGRVTSPSSSRLFAYSNDDMEDEDEDDGGGDGSW